jgi:hypothetical protein
LEITDTGNTYSWRQSSDGAADTTDVSPITKLLQESTNVGSFHNIFIINNLANEKLVINHNVSKVQQEQEQLQKEWNCW